MKERGPSNEDITTVSKFIADKGNQVLRTNETGRPMMLTEHGRPKFLITPLDDQEVVSGALKHMVESGKLDTSSEGPTYTSEEVMRELDSRSDETSGVDIDPKAEPHNKNK